MFGCLESEMRLSHDFVMQMFPTTDKKEKLHDAQSTTSASVVKFGHEYIEPAPNKFEQKCIDWIKNNPADYRFDIFVRLGRLHTDSQWRF